MAAIFRIGLYGWKNSQFNMFGGSLCQAMRWCAIENNGRVMHFQARFLHTLVGMFETWLDLCPRCV